MQNKQISQKISSNHLLILKQRMDVLESNDLFVFTLSHGQTQIERGFNVNAGLLVENLTSSLIVAQRRVYDHLSFNKRSPHGFEIKDELCVSCPNAPSKYKENLKEIKYAEKSKK